MDIYYFDLLLTIPLLIHIGFDNERNGDKRTLLANLHTAMFSCYGITSRDPIATKHG